MGHTKSILFPSQERILVKLGENIKLARLRRDLSSEEVSKRAGIARNTLIKIEKGSENVAIGSYMKVLFVLNLENDLEAVAKDDVLGRKLQDAKILVKERASKKVQTTND